MNLDGSTPRLNNAPPKSEHNGHLPPINALANGLTKMEPVADGAAHRPVNELEFLNGPDQVLPADNIWTSKPGGTVKLCIAESGVGSAPPISVPSVITRTANNYPNTVALRQEKNGKWLTWTYAEYLRDIRTAAKAFIKLGLRRFSGVCILGFNSPEWFIADYAAIFAGGLAAGIYTTNSAEACLHCAQNCEAGIFVVENEKQLEKVLQIKDKLPSLKAIIQYDGNVTSPGVISWAEMMDIGKDESDSELERRLKMMGVNQGCTVIYTSGTTGPPKGAVISHDNLTFTTGAVVMGVKLAYGCEQLVSYLPLSHIAAQLVDMHIPCFIGATVTFAKPDALKGSLPKTLQAVRPTLFLGVPRVFEKIQEKMLEVGRQNTGLKKALAQWAKASGLHYHQRRIKHGRGPWSPSYIVARSIIFKKIKAALGLDRIKILVSGAAPIAKEVLEYFLSLDLPIQQVYGMSECTGPVTFEQFENMSIGSVGQCVDGLFVKIDQPDADGNGEVCMGGRNVFMGYLKQPDKTEEAIDPDGWLHSGDIGKLDKKGRMYITGRIKELIITAGGENIPPVLIEEQVLKNVPALSNAMLIGDQKKFLTMLVTMKSVLDLDTGESQDELTPQAIEWCKSHGSNAKTVSEILNGPDAKVMKAIQDGIDEYNKKGAISQAQRIGKWKLLPRDFTQLGGELGPTMKLKRSFVVQKYAAEIESLYA